MDLTLQQDKRYSRDTLLVDDRQVIIRSSALGLSSGKELWLRDIDPSPRRVRTPRVLGAIILVAIGLAPLLAFAKVSLRDQFYWGPLYLVSIWSFSFLGGSVIVVRGVVAYQFVNAEGALLFQIFAPKGKRLAAEKFVEELSTKIASLRGRQGMPNQSSEPTRASGTSPAGQEPRLP